MVPAYRTAATVLPHLSLTQHRPLRVRSLPADVHRRLAERVLSLPVELLGPGDDAPLSDRVDTGNQGHGTVGSAARADDLLIVPRRALADGLPQWSCRRLEPEQDDPRFRLTVDRTGSNGPFLVALAPPDFTGDERVRRVDVAVVVGDDSRTGLRQQGEEVGEGVNY
jgi:hypothetical protein